MRKFNVTGLCNANMHYMVDISNKINQIAGMVEQGDYFTINRGRQYGKTTTLALLERELIKKEYTVIKVSFEAVDDRVFECPENFCQGLLHICSQYFKERNLPGSETWIDSSVTTFDLLGNFLTKTCENKKIVLMIDEVDKTSNNFIFLKFLGMLRDKYLKRNDGVGATFQSVILAGVYDIRNLKIKMVQAGTHKLQDGEKRLNSPWNIAVEFKVDMSFSAPEIETMLLEYEKENKTGMDIKELAIEIRSYTNGYPYLVSRLCQIIDCDLNKNWTINGVQEAVKEILFEKSTLFDDIFKNIESNPDLKELLRELTVGNRAYSYNIDNQAIQIASVYGIVEKKERLAAIHNRIFEVRITNYFASEKEQRDGKLTMRTSVECVTAGDKFNMELFLEKFAGHYYEMYNSRDIDFLERECRLLFITYLIPYINGIGFYHLESEIRNAKRTDVIVDYQSEQFVVELKLWYGDVAHEEAFEQIAGYLDSKNKDTGYLLTFDFRKTQNVGKPQAKWVEHKGKRILDVMVGV